MKKLSFLFAALVAGVSYVSLGAGDPVPTDLGEDLTDPEGTITTTIGGNWVKPAKNAFDNGTKHNNDDRSINQSSNVDWIYTFAAPTVVNCYRVWAPASNTGVYNWDKRMTKAWTFEGSLDYDPSTKQGTWFPLDTRADQTDWTSHEGRFFMIENNTAYTSYRFHSTAYNSGSDGYTQIDELEYFFYLNFKVDEVSLLRSSDGSKYTVSGKVVGKEADTVSVVLLTDDPALCSTNQIAAGVAADAGFEADILLSDLAEDATYKVGLLLTAGEKSVYCDVDTLYTGSLMAALKSNAKEEGAVPGLVTVSRAQASQYPLSVNYSFTDGTAVCGIDYVAAQSPVVIPADAASVDIPVVPLVNADKKDDLVMTVTVEPGNYTAPADSVAMTIVNASLPSDKNVWVAGASSDGLASTASNWSKGVPKSTDDILLGGNYSSQDMIWDAGVNGLPATVGSWTQEANYTGTVEFLTKYPVTADPFQLFTVTGALVVNGGTWTHPLSVNKDGDKTKYTIDQIRSAYTYRLNIEAGSFTLGVGAKVDLVGKGMSRNKTTAKLSTLAPVHGGQFEDSPVNCYGNPKYPEDIGWAGNVVSDRTQKHAAGGGAFKLKSTGDVVINGEINVDGEVVSDSSGGAAGAAGSVLIEAKSVSGAGKIHADGLYNKGKDSAYDGQNGAGGRIAILTIDPVDLSTLMVSASAEVCGSNGKKAQAGTVYVKDASMNKGVLYVRNLLDQTSTAKAFKRATTVSEDGDWSFDQIVLSGNVQLFVPEGKTLAVPTFEDISCPDVTRTASLFVKGSLDFAKATKYTLSGNWNFAPLSEVVFDGDLEVKNGANLGVAGLSNLVDNGSELPDYASIKVKVNGDMTIAQSGMMTVVGGGVVKYNNTLNSGCKGVLPDATHGGRIYAYVSKGMYAAYDSIFAPHLPGNAVPNPNGQYADQSAGVITLVVSGGLTVDGAIDANGSPADYDQGGNCAGGVGGSIDITAGSLLGSGEIRADGGSKPVNRGAGGRVAVKLTDMAADFASFAGNISAGGRVRQQSQYQASNDSSAGTIYLQSGADGEKCGTIRIAQRQSTRTKKDVINGKTKIECDEMYAAVSATTEIVSLGYGGDQIDDYKSVKVEMKDFGHAAVNADVQLAQMTVATDNAFVDLEGHVLTVGKFVYFDGTKLVRLNPGTYTLAQLEALGVTCVRDSVGGGSLLVKGTGMVLLVR